MSTSRSSRVWSNSELFWSYVVGVVVVLSDGADKKIKKPLCRQGRYEDQTELKLLEEASCKTDSAYCADAEKIVVLTIS